MYPLVTKCIVFIAGFAILSLEILGFRILVPFTGATTPVWASVISVTLLGSVLGYYIGGAFADRAQNKNILASLVFGAGLLFLAILPARAVVRVIVSFVGSYSASALLASLALFLFPILGLSSMITYAIRCSLFNIETVARVHGDLYTIATIGSIAGVFVTSYVLIPNFTISSIIMGQGAILISIAVVIKTKNSKTVQVGKLVGEIVGRGKVVG